MRQLALDVAAPARAARDEGIAKVEQRHPTFFDSALPLVREWLLCKFLENENAEFIAQDVWADVLSNPKCPGVSHPNQLGAAWNSVVRKRWVRHTGEFKQSWKVSCHAHFYKVYRINVQELVK